MKTRLFPLSLLLAACGHLCAGPVTSHPRLLFRAGDLPVLRARMTPSNDVWMHFKSEVVDKALVAWRCSSTSMQKFVDPDPNKAGDEYTTWVRTSFTDENGVTHLPTDADWDSGKWSSVSERPAVPEDDVGEGTGIVRLASEQYAMLYALMARLLDDGTSANTALHSEYLLAAKTCLFNVIDKAHLGSDDAQPWRQSYFAQADRSFYNESFALAVDWIYEDLTAVELAKVRKAFLVWAEQSNAHTYFAPRRVNGQHGPVNSPALLRLNEPDQAVRRDEIRLALNNHWANHLRQLILYGLALDPADDVPVTQGHPAYGTVTDTAPAGAVTSQIVGSGGPGDWVPIDTGVLRDATGVWLYLTDYAYRHDGAGGPSLEGTEYATNGLGPVALALTAMQVAGQDRPEVWGPQVKMAGHPFWERQIPAYLSLLPPAPRVASQIPYLGAVFQPPLYGDLETFAYMSDQFIKELGPLCIADAARNGPSGAGAQAIRYIQRHLAPGSDALLQKRIADTASSKSLRDAIYYFLVFDPAAPAPADPRTDALQPLTFYAAHTVNGREMGLVTARTGRTAADTYFHFRTDWNRINHQRGDSLSFGLWKNGLWLTKVMTGYGGLQGCSDYRNALSLQNGPVVGDDRKNVDQGEVSDHGGQWYYGCAGDPAITARSFGQGFLYLTADATNLYNHISLPGVNQITHASRSIVWLKPNHVVVYDRAVSPSGLFKRFYLNLPSTQAQTTISGNLVHATAREGTTAKAELFVTALLPAGATPQLTDIASGQPAGGVNQEDMKCRMVTEAPGAPAQARFLHVLQGADAGLAMPDATQLVATADGKFQGALIGSTCVAFRSDLADTTQSLVLPGVATAAKFYITGLQPGAGYDASLAGGQLTITPGTQRYADSGGVLVWEPGGGTTEPPTIALVATDADGSEQGGGAVTFILTRSGSLAQPLAVSLAYAGSATAADFASALPASLTIPAGQASASLTLVPADDTAYEGEETLVLTATPAAGYHADEAAASATATIADNDAPPGGTLQLTAATFTGTEGGTVTITLSRTGGSADAVSVHLTAAAGSATSGADFAATSTTVSWADGDAAVKTVAISLPNDATYEGDEAFTVSLSLVTGPAALGTPSSATVTIQDDDPPPPGQLELSPASATLEEGSQSAVTFTVTRTGGTGGYAKVDYATANGTATSGADYTATTGTLEWADGQAGPRTITIPLADDTLYEGDSETFTLALTGATGAPIAGPASAAITLTENDPPPAAYHVGPGQAYATPADVPWLKVGAGSTVYLHYRATPYANKILLANTGTAAQPIRLIGLKDPATGARPILDGDGAAAPTGVLYPAYTSVEDESLIAISRHHASPAAHKPAHIEILGLEIRGARREHTYLRQGDGAPDAYSDNAGGIYIAGSDHVTIADCEIHDCAQGIVTSAGGADEPGLVRDLVIDGCHFHDNGKAGEYWGRNLATQGVGITLRHSRLEPPLSGKNVENVRDRSAGFTAHGNWIDGGGSQIRLEDPAGTVPLLTGDPTWGQTRITANILRSFESEAATLISVNGSLPRQIAFHYNSVHAQSGYARSVLALNSAAHTATAVDNALWAAGITEFRLATGPGTATYGANFARTGYLPGTATVGGPIVTAATSPYAAEATGDYSPATGSPLVDAAVALPGGLPPPGSQLHAPYGAVARPATGAAHDIGALEAGADQSAYAAWAYGYFGSDTAAAAPGADPDGDGATNLAEFQAGTDPTHDDTAVPPTPTPTVPTPTPTVPTPTPTVPTPTPTVPTPTPTVPTPTPTVPTPTPTVPTPTPTDPTPTPTGPTPTPTVPIPTPTDPTPTPTPAQGAPTVKILGKKKIVTSKPKVRLRGTATGTVTAVQVKAGKKTVKAKGTTSWSAKVKVKPGRNKITAVATGPGGTSAPAKATILRR